MRRVLIAFVIGLAIGCLMIGRVDVLSLPAGVSVPVMGVLLGLMLVLVLVMFFLHRRRHLYAFSFSAFIFFIVLGSVAFQLKYQHCQSKQSSLVGKHVVQGVVTKRPQRKTLSLAVEMQTSQGVSFICYLNHDPVIANPVSEPDIGDTLLIFSKHGLTPSSFLPDSTDEFAAYRRYLFLHEIAGTCYAESRHVTKGQPDGLMAVRKMLNNQLQQLLDTALPIGDRDELSVVTAMTTGDKSELSKELREQYSHAGVSHVLALSGFHLTIIYMLLQLMLLAWVGSDRWRKVARGLIIIAIWAFVAVTGFPPSLVRAAIMFSILLLTQIVRRRVNSVDVLCVTVMVMLCVNPFMLLDVGFELSVLSMLGLLTMGTWLFGWWTDQRRKIGRDGWLKRMAGKVADFVVGSVITTVVCSMMTLPLVSYYFGIVPLLSVGSNLVMSLLATALMAVAAVWWMVSWQQQLSAWVGTGVMGIAAMMNGVTSWFSSIDFAVIPWRANAWGIAMWYFLIAFLLIYGARYLPTYGNGVGRRK
ncbi:MAG: ComEC/Rec2 family competence protein [Bacteroidaceae bacterium]|nr:ComEC/Rec2 family competence protein [Bacteroidaceae bacterium]